MRVTATKLRQNIYRILDKILQNGIPVEIERKGKILKIIPEKPVRKLDNLKSHQTIVGDPEDLVNGDWSSLWQEEDNI